jgi:hypothetical protein
VRYLDIGLRVIRSKELAIGNTTRDFGNIPMSCALPVGDATPQPLRGGKEYTDSQSNVSTNVAMSPEDGWKPTYTYTISATAPYATPTDWVVIRGSATKTVKVVHIEYSGVATAATAGNIILVKKHTIANTAGTSTNPAAIKHDSNDGNATALVLLYSVAPTIDGTAVIWKTVRLTYGLVAAAAGTWAQDRYVWDQGSSPFEAMTLRGVAQELAFNFNSVAIPAGGVYDLSVTWTEE